jgi:hypothetical protein
VRSAARSARSRGPLGVDGAHSPGPILERRTRRGNSAGVRLRRWYAGAVVTTAGRRSAFERRTASRASPARADDEGLIKGNEKRLRRSGAVNRGIDRAEATGVGRADALSEGWVVIAYAPEAMAVGRSGRRPSSSPRGRVLDDDKVGLIGLGAGQGRTLRESAGEFGVSHETIRAVLRVASCSDSSLSGR